MGMKCLRPCQNHYCNKHLKNLQFFQNTLKEHFLNESFRIQELYKYIGVVPIHILKIIINYLYTHNYLILYMPNYRIYTKAKCIDVLIEMHTKLYYINSYFIKSIILLQQSFRKRNLQGPHLITKPINDTDPFTLESIKELSPDLVFSYKNKENHVYAFSVYELMYHFENNGLYNPLTREPITMNIMHRLNHYINRLKYEKPSFENKWETPYQAFIDLVYKYERYGIYTSVDWFMKLSFTQIMNMFILYHCYMNEHHLNLFDMKEMDEALIEQESIILAQFALAREMKKLIELQHDMKLYFICNFFVILASINKIVGESLPNWIWLASQLPPN